MAIKTFARGVAFYHPKLPILDGSFKIANWVRFASSFKVASCSLTFLVTCPAQFDASDFVPIRHIINIFMIQNDTMMAFQMQFIAIWRRFSGTQL